MREQGKNGLFTNKRLAEKIPELEKQPEEEINWHEQYADEFDLKINSSEIEELVSTQNAVDYTKIMGTCNSIIAEAPQERIINNLLNTPELKLKSEVEENNYIYPVCQEEFKHETKASYEVKSAVKHEE
jgi:hypothetical protein